ncbi:MAG: hypothetical protein E7223_06590 [Clostridiales bacterium]|nr:hypothetical protein [Clostridiales bacterium]
MERGRQLLGIAFLALALCGLIAWESWGRGYFLTEEVLLAREPIEAGTALSAALFSAGKVEKDSLAEGALTPEQLALLQGKVTNSQIPQNGQITVSQLREQDFYLGKGESIFVLKGEWISLRSSSLRRGDWIDVYALQEGAERGAEMPEEASGGSEAGGESGSRDAFPGTYLGTYRVAFVKDSNEVEVVNAAGGERAEALQRTDSTAKIGSVEIIAGTEDYGTLLRGLSEALKRNAEEAKSGKSAGNAAGTEGGACLLLVQREAVR